MNDRFEAERRDQPVGKHGTMQEPHLTGVLRGLIFLFMAGLLFLAVSFAHSLLQLSWTDYSLATSRPVLKFAITHRYE